MSPRLRERVVPGFPQESRRILGNLATDYVAVVPAHPVAFHQKIFDYPERDKKKIMKEFRNQRAGHYLPGGRPAHAEHHSQLYLETVNSATGEITWYPTMMFVQAMSTTYPWLLTPPNFQKELDELKYPECVLKGWSTKHIDLGFDFSLINFIIELGEVVTTCHMYLSKRVIIDRTRALLSRRSTLSQRALVLAEERLARVYGVEPFIADVRKIYQILTNWQTRADRIIADQGALKGAYANPVALFRQRSYSLELPLFTQALARVYVRESVQVDLHSTLGYTYSMPELSGFLGRLAQLSEAFGVRLDGGIVWNATRFSFIADWFVNIGEWLSANSIQTWGCDVKFRAACQSRRVHAIRTVSWGYSGEESSFAILSSEWLDYHRELIAVPVISAKQVQLGTGWNTARILNASALSVQAAPRASKVIKGAVKEVKVGFKKLNAAERRAARREAKRVEREKRRLYYSNRRINIAARLHANKIAGSIPGSASWWRHFTAKRNAIIDRKDLRALQRRLMR